MRLARRQAIVSRLVAIEETAVLLRAEEPDLVEEIFADLGNLASRYRLVVLYLNGEYWGLYNLTERVDLMRKCQEHGAGAVVMKSYFEEEVSRLIDREVRVQGRVNVRIRNYAAVRKSGKRRHQRGLARSPLPTYHHKLFRLFCGSKNFGHFLQGGGPGGSVTVTGSWPPATTRCPGAASTPTSRSSPPAVEPPASSLSRASRILPFRYPGVEANTCPAAPA